MNNQLRAAWLAAVLALAPGCGGGGTGATDVAPGYDVVAESGMDPDAMPIPDVEAVDRGPDLSADLAPETGDVAVETVGDVPGEGPSDAAPEAVSETVSEVTADVGPAACPRTPAAADRPRKVVVSHPYDAAGEKANAWELLDLATDGTLSVPGAPFTMGRSADGEFAFTPDGKVGLVAQEDGTVGVVRIGDDGLPYVVHAGFALKSVGEGSAYADHVVMDPAGDRAWVLSGQWRNNGGGVYLVLIGCDGTLTDGGLIAPSKLPAALAFVPGGSGRAVLAASDVLDSSGTGDAWLLQWGATPAVIGGATGFGDPDLIVSSMALTQDGKYALIADDNEMDENAFGIAVVEILADGLAPRQLIKTMGASGAAMNDPYRLLVSPWDNAALMVSGYGNAILGLARSAGDPAQPFGIPQPISYVGKAPQLPSSTVMVGQGALKGLVLSVETDGVRRVQFQADGSITDLGLFPLGDGMERMAGAIGVQP